MKVTINFNSEAFKTQFVNKANSIKSSVTVEFSAEQIAALTEEQRALLLKYTHPCKGTSSFDEDRYMINPYSNSTSELQCWHYTEDVFAIITECEALLEQSRQKAMQKVSKDNAAMELRDSARNCSRGVAYHYVVVRHDYESSMHGFDLAVVYRDTVRVYDTDVDRQTMHGRLMQLGIDRDVVISRDEFIAQLIRLSDQAYDEREAYDKEQQERKQREEADKLKEAEERKQREERVSAWIAEHGSDYLKDLKQNGFDYNDAYDKEYAVFTYGENAHLSNETYEYDKDYDDATDKVLSPTPEHLNEFIRFKEAHPSVVCTLQYIDIEEEDYYIDDDTPAFKHVDYDEYSTVLVCVDDPDCNRYIYVEL